MKKLMMLLLALGAAIVTRAQSFRSNNSELFLVINDNGIYTVSVDNQQISSPTGKFRFFDLQAGKSVLTITANNNTLFKDFVNIAPNTRIVVSYTNRRGLKQGPVLTVYQNGVYALDNWDSQIIAPPPVVNLPDNIRPPRGPRVLSQDDFARLQQAIRSSAFPADKKNTFKAALQNNLIVVGQISEILKQFSFDDDKLDIIKVAYPYTADLNRFFQLRSSLTFSSAQDSFDKFLRNATDNDRTDRPINILRKDEFARLRDMIKAEPFADGKKKIFRNAAQNNMVTVAQVSELMRLFTFDDEKMDWAIMAYKYTADTQRYYQLRDLFTFDINKAKLDKFLIQAE